MKNISSILTLLAISATLVSSRALPVALDGVAELSEREPMPLADSKVHLKTSGHLLTVKSLKSIQSFTQGS
jgi:hypothetical protein